MDESILNSIKKLLGIDPSYDIYDHDIILHINSVFSVLHQIGASPPERAYRITGSTETWSLFVTDLENVDLVKTYMYLRVRLLFDPPANSFAIDAIKTQITEFEWRLQKLENVFNPFALPDTQDDIWPSMFATANQGVLAESASQPGHSHVVADITDFLDEVSGIVASLLGAYAPLEHDHAIADVTDLQAALDTLSGDKVNNNDTRLTDAREPLPHVHDISDITGLDLSGYTTDAELTAEASARLAADNALDARVDTLEGAVPDLSGYATDAELASEAATRLAADNALDARVDTLESSSGPDLSGYATDAELASEASTRASADSALSASISTLNSDKAPVIHIHTKGDITDFNEAVEDLIGAMVQAAGGVYNDTLGTVVFPRTYRGLWSSYSIVDSYPATSGQLSAFTNPGGYVISTKPSRTGTPPGGANVFDSGSFGGAGTRDFSFVVPAGVSAIRCIANLTNFFNPNATQSKMGILVNGTETSMITGTATGAWVELLAAVSPGQTVTMRTYDGGYSTQGYFGQIDLLMASEPYMVDHTVVYGNRLYRSTVENNTSTPGVNSDWAEVVLTIDAADITDSTSTGRSVLTAANASAARTAIGASPTSQTISAKTASYTLVLGDVDTTITMDSTSAMTLSIPTNGTVAWPVGACVNVIVLNTGMVTVAAVTPGTTTVNGTPSLVSRARYSAFTLMKIATDTWVVIGDLA